MTPPRAQTENVSRHFGDNVAVDQVSVAVHGGEVVGLLGANGAGKTTLIRMILGLLTPSEGVVRLMGGPPSRETRKDIGYTPQGLGLYDDLTVAENLAFVTAAYGVDSPHLSGDLATVADTPIAEVPLGLRRRASFAAALSHRPDLLVLDEPTSGVDPLGRADLWDTIHTAADDGAAVLVTTHYMDEAEQCDRLVILATGKEVASGTVPEIVAGHSTTEIAVNDVVAALSAMEDHGVPAIPSGHRLRIPGRSIEEVRAMLGPVTIESFQTGHATLEEAFMSMATAS